MDHQYIFQYMNKLEYDWIRSILLLFRMILDMDPNIFHVYMPDYLDILNWLDILVDNLAEIRCKLVNMNTKELHLCFDILNKVHTAMVDMDLLAHLVVY